MRMATMPTMLAQTWPWDDATVQVRQDISTAFYILIEFEATEYSYSIRFVLRISRRFNLIINSSEIPDLSHPYEIDVCMVYSSVDGI